MRSHDARGGALILLDAANTTTRGWVETRPAKLCFLWLHTVATHQTDLALVSAASSSINAPPLASCDLIALVGLLIEAPDAWCRATTVRTIITSAESPKGGILND
jgi:hypothetical protein